LYTSDIDRRLYSTGVKYLIAAAAAAAAGAVYELFSHGVYSYYMIYAFMVPLVGGAIPCLVTAAKAGKKRRPRDAEATISAKLQLAAVATLTAGSFMRGVLEIYGTTNKLTVIYAAAGLALATAALLSFAADRRGLQREFIEES
jgi:peptidoglycan/LPS O-acetylase OafA/YrhL